MPRRLTPFVSGLYYHIYNRGNNRQSIFFQPQNYLYFLRNKELSPPSSKRDGVLFDAHALSPGDKVKQTSQTSESLSQVLMMRLSVSYTKAINKRFERVGSLFQGQFQAKPIQSYHHLLNLCIDLHANPVKDGLVTDPADWVYSNYLEWLGQRDGMLVDRNSCKSILVHRRNIGN